MSPNAFNETLQWMTLAVALLLILGLYRQLGLMVAGARQFQTDSFGPQIGAKANRKLRAAVPEGHWRDWNVIVFVLEACPTCEQFLETFRGRGLLGAENVTLAVVAAGNERFFSELRRELSPALVSSVDELLGEQGTLGGREVSGYPFAFLLDRDGVVRQKVLGADPGPIIQEIGAAQPV